MSAPPRHAPLYLSVALVSGAALAYEVLLTRLLAIVHWHHFAYLVISLALLGFGASGALLSLCGDWCTRRFRACYVANAALFGAGAPLCFAIVQGLPFNALEVAWSARQWGWLALLFLCLAIPFFGAASCIALAFLRHRERIAAVYAADLAGAGLGAAAVIGWLYLAPPEGVLQGLAALGLAAAVPVGWGGGRGLRVASAGLALAAAILALSPPMLVLAPSHFKALSQALQVDGARVVATRTSPLGVLTAVENERIPIRHAPGLSLASTGGIAPQIGVFTDAEHLRVITRFDGDFDPLRYLAETTSALPYHVVQADRVLVLGAGGGAGVLQALQAGAGEVHAVELDPEMVALVREDFADFAGELYRHPKVRVHVAEARDHLRAGPERYDLIQIALLDSFAASAAGLHASSESYLYTVEAIRAGLERLRPGGVLAFTRWVKVPPRDGVKLFATLIAALEERGDAEPARHLAWIRGWSTGTLMVKREAWSEAEVAAIRDFARSRSFDPVHYPGVTPEEANRFNRLDRPWFFEAAAALLGPERERFTERYKFHVEPARDDRPHFSRFVKWTHLPELLRLQRQGGIGLLELGYPILVATLAVSLLAGTLLILAPLALLPAPARLSPGRGGICAYFLCIGFAFLALEIAFIQKTMLLLGAPVLAVSVVLGTFLVSAGTGSLAVHRRGARALPLRAVAVAIAGLCGAYLWGLPAFVEAAASLPLGVRAALVVVLLFPLGVLMGMPFPAGLRRLAGAAAPWIPWAWGINGCASVSGAVASTLLAVHFGFAAVVLLAAGAYLLAGALERVSFPRSGRGGRDFGRPLSPP